MPGSHGCRPPPRLSVRVPPPPAPPAVFVTLTCAFRYGREDLDVLGLSFRKDLFVATRQAVPPLPEEHRPPTRLQQRLLRKLGPAAYPFAFTVSPAPRLPHGLGCPRGGSPRGRFGGSLRPRWYYGRLGGGLLRRGCLM